MPINMERVARARRRKTFFPRVHPMLRYDEQKFQERYRLSKAVVEELCIDFEASGFCTTALGSWGGSLGIDDRVSFAFKRLMMLLNVIKKIL